LSWSRKHLLGLEGLTREELTTVLEEAAVMKPVAAGQKPKLRDMAGRTVVNLFFEPSTRTSNAFAAAARKVGADLVNFSTKASSLGKGESLSDTARNLEAIGADVFVVRHSSPGVPRMLAERTRASVVNAGDGRHEHPTQGLLDIFTIHDELGRVEGLTVGILGDILHSRVARSNIWGLRALGARVVLIGPPTLLPRELTSCGAELCEDLDAVLPELDVVNVLRLQLERMESAYLPSLREYARVWGLNAERLARGKPGLLVMHPGPTNRGVELTPEVADGPRSAILRQVTNGVAVRMAVLRLVTGIAGVRDHG
jgi:aspartate carbamoyltransferase catalytic subunit